jgi:CII-binding regulator of phage lambda lysogenization HflD
VQILHDRIESEFRKLKSNITRIVLKIYFIWAPLDFTKDTIETIGIKIKHIEEEIEIRVESIKIELDEIHEAFKNELNNFKNELVE